MFGFLLLLYQLFLGGHFGLSLSSHPSNKLEGPLVSFRPDLTERSHRNKQVYLPEWRYKGGRCLYVGKDIETFFMLTQNERRDSYIRSNATMKQEGWCALVLIAVASFSTIALQMALLREQDAHSVCPIQSELLLWTRMELSLGVGAVLWMWITNVRGVPRSSLLWSMLALVFVVDCGINAWGTYLVVQATQQMCFLSAPALTNTVSGCTIVASWLSFIVLVSIIKHTCFTTTVKREKKREMRRKFKSAVNFVSATTRLRAKSPAAPANADENGEPSSPAVGTSSLSGAVPTAKPASTPDVLRTHEE